MRLSNASHDTIAPPPANGRGWVRDVHGSTFSREVLQAPAGAVVEFMSYSCSHCRDLEPALQAAAQAVHDAQQVFRVNVAMEPELAGTYQIHGTPTLVMFRDGVEVARVVGPPAQGLLAAITQPFE